MLSPAVARQKQICEEVTPGPVIWRRLFPFFCFFQSSLQFGKRLIRELYGPHRVHASFEKPSTELLPVQEVADLLPKLRQMLFLLLYITLDSLYFLCDHLGPHLGRRRKAAIELSCRMIND